MLLNQLCIFKIYSYPDFSSFLSKKKKSGTINQISKAIFFKSYFAIALTFLFNF